MSYTRKAAICHDAGSGSGGCSGALAQLFERFPDVEADVQELFFKDGKKHTVHEARIGINVIHNHFKKKLRAKGLGNNDWPFNTANCGYKSLAMYLSKVREENAARCALPRSGREAAQRGAIGNGSRSIIPTLRAFSFAQLDFHKIDAASIIILKNEFGGELLVPISRWHIGFLVEEKLGAILGACIALERTPSGDSTLEIIDNALRPEERHFEDPLCKFLPDGQMLVRDFFPELSYQCFSGLKVDNGWSNAAHEVVNNIMDTVGCAVNFGPVRAWWRRSLIESIFGILERKGLQRLPSTYGSSPQDTRKDDPNAKAIKFRISLNEVISVVYGCIREHNLAHTEKLQWTSPIAAIQSALGRPGSGLFPQPLPRTVQNNPRLLMHIEEVTVRGNIKKNERPYFTTDRCTHTNEILANSYWLVGKKLLIYVDRRKCRNVYASVKETGEWLGKMIPESKWAKSECSWRDRKLINRSGIAARCATDFFDPVTELLESKTHQVLRRPKKDQKRSSSEGLDIARIARASNAETLRGKDARSIEESTPTVEKRIEKRDPFGLSDIPSVASIIRRN